MGLGAAGTHGMITCSEHGGKHGRPHHTQGLPVVPQKKEGLRAPLLKTVPGMTGTWRAGSMVLCDTVLAGVCRCWCLSVSSSFDALFG